MLRWRKEEPKSRDSTRISTCSMVWARTTLQCHPNDLGHGVPHCFLWLLSIHLKVLTMFL